MRCQSQATGVIVVNMCVVFDCYNDCDFIYFWSNANAPVIVVLQFLQGLLVHDLGFACN